MNKVFWILLFGFVGFTSCEEEVTADANVSNHEFGEFFYQYDTVPKIYVFRNQVNGIEEEFHRVFGINDSQGKHVVVEVYKDDGRITEALNYNLDSLDVIDHMVVDRDQLNKKAELFKDKLFPDNKKATSSFASRFPGIKDSTMFLKEVDRKFESSKKIGILDKQVSATIFHDYIRMTLFNPFTKEENVGQWEFINYFAAGYGLVEWHTPDKSFHFRLEKIISQDEFVNLMSN